MRKSAGHILVDADYIMFLKICNTVLRKNDFQPQKSNLCYQDAGRVQSRADGMETLTHASHGSMKIKNYIIE